MMMPFQFRQPNGRDSSLTEGQVHVWCVRFSRLEPYVDQMRSHLSRDEQLRAGRYHFKKDSRRFIVRRFALRSFLGQYLGVDLGRLRFDNGRHGKPRLAAEFLSHQLHFNLSYSNDLAVYAFASGRRVGVDVEHIRPVPEADQIASWFFSRHERDTLFSLTREHKQIAFYNCWTRKEAYIKAVGSGLSQPLDRFSVTLKPEEPARIISLGNGSNSSQWSLAGWTPAEGYIAALAVEAHIHEDRQRNFRIFTSLTSDVEGVNAQCLERSLS